MDYSKEELLNTASLDKEFAAIWQKFSHKALKLSGDPNDVRRGLIERKKLAASVTPPDPEASAGVSEEDATVVARDGYHIPIRIHRPNPDSTGGPLAVMAHGGGWVLGDLEMLTPMCRLFVKELGMTCINVGYRLAPENPFPIPVYDLYDVTKWATVNASNLGADLGKGFILGGESAGANLVDAAAHLALDEAMTPKLTGLLELVPPLSSSYMRKEYLAMSLSHAQNIHAPILPKSSVDWSMEQYGADERSPLFSPHMHPSGHKGIPPIYFVSCGADPLRDDPIIYGRVLKEEYGIESKLDMYPGLPHSFWSFFPMLKACGPFYKNLVAGMRWLLEQGKA